MHNGTREQCLNGQKNKEKEAEECESKEMSYHSNSTRE